MESKVKILGHPVHPMVIVFPLGLLSTAVVFDLIGLATDDSDWYEVSYYLLGAGIVGGFAAAVFGLIDWLAIPTNTRAKQVGLYHALSNSVGLAFFIASWYLRYDGSVQDPETLAIVLSLLGAGAASLGGWLGGELVYRLGIAVDHGANPDAPSSLSDAPATRKTADYRG